jgi:hypothetical protein
MSRACFHIRQLLRYYCNVAIVTTIIAALGTGTAVLSGLLLYKSLHPEININIHMSIDLSKLPM